MITVCGEERTAGEYTRQAGLAMLILAEVFVSADDLHATESVDPVKVFHVVGDKGGIGAAGSARDQHVAVPHCAFCGEL